MPLDAEVRKILDDAIEDRRTRAALYQYGGRRAFPVGRAEGTWVYDEYGNPYLDFGAGAAVNLLGHRNPRVVGAALDHLVHYVYTGDDHLTRFPAEYAEALSARFPDKDGQPRQVLVTASVRDAHAVASAIERYPCEQPYSEVDTGFGRTGMMWGFQQLGLVPDIVVLGPSGGGGLPFAAVVAPAGVMARLDEAPRLAAHPLSCATALAVLEQITDELLEHVVRMGEVLAGGIAELVGQFDTILEPTNGVGLLQKLSTKDKGAAQRLREDCRAKGLLMHPDLTLTPPLTVEEREVRQAIDVIADVLLDWR